MLVHGAALLEKCRTQLKEFHTRTQRKAFKQQLSNLVKVPPCIADFVYQQLSLDRTEIDSDMQHRLNFIFLGETDLMSDMRALNGSEGGVYEPYFEKMSVLIEEFTAADERRHGEVHFSQALSVRDLMAQTKANCPPGTPEPSISLVFLQFAPRNPYTRRAFSFTSRIDVQHKVQRRQLRVDHPDQHYASAQLKYLKQRAVELGEDCALLCADDKAKVPIGEPEVYVSTGVRGRKSIVPTDQTLVALDHDMTKCSITPSVVLCCDVPEDVERSFVQGQVVVNINDSVFQQSSPWRHACMTAKIFEDRNVPPILLKITDGGTDHRHTLESVRLANICLFKEMSFDQIILARPAPGHSWQNPAERVMSILNLGLQNTSLCRGKMDDETEYRVKSCNSMSDIRKKLNDDEKVKWNASVEEPKIIVKERFERLALKDKKLECQGSVTHLEMDLMKRHSRDLFPTLDLSKLQKLHMLKIPAYVDWVRRHCRETHYTFQIVKCQDPECCGPTRVKRELLTWLPSPLIGEEDHYLAYSELNGQETTEKDRPSLQIPKPSRKRKGRDGGIICFRLPQTFLDMNFKSFKKKM